MTLAVYVAGASAERERVRRAMDAVRAEGWHLTLDWLAVIDAAGAANEGLDDRTRFLAAHEDLQAIRHADVVWLLAPEAQSTGAWVELGYALAQYLPVVVSGPASRRCIFASFADEHDTDEAALEHLRRVARGDSR